MLKRCLFGEMGDEEGDGFIGDVYKDQSCDSKWFKTQHKIWRRTLK